MTRNGKNMEELFAEGFEEYRMEPSAQTWQKLSKKLAWQNFLHFSPVRMNIFYTGLILVLGAAALVFTNRNHHPLPQPQNTQENKVEDHIPSAEQNLIPGKEVSKKSSTAREKDSDYKDIDIQEVNTVVTPKKTKPAVTTDSSVQKHQSTAEQAIPRDNYLLPTAIFTPNQSEGCVPCRIVFKNHSINALSYEWSFGDGGSSEAENPVYIFDEPGTYYVSLSARGADNSISRYTETITIYPLPKVRFDMDKSTITEHGQTVNFYNYSRDAVEYNWDFGDGGTSNLSDPAWIYSKPGNYDVKLRAVSEKGCTDSMMIKNAFTEESHEVVFPNAFSPNLNGPGGGYYTSGEVNNNVFHPYSAEKPVEYQLRIFNRKGNLIFESNDYNIGWDGYYMQELQPQGVYIYKVRGRFANGKVFTRAGDVMLLWKE